MDQKDYSFWLVVINDNSVNVGLVVYRESLSISFVQRELPWEDQTTLIEAINQLIETSSQQNSLDPALEPNKTAFIISPFWVASDGRIIDTKLKLLQDTCQQLKLTPMGFMPFDEAVVEESNQSVGIPESFVLAHIDSQQLIVSVCYLGKIKKRLRKLFSGRFQPSLLESSLMEMNLESALPPLIKISGQADESILKELKNYPWISKKSYETFLHLPEVQSISKDKLHQLFAKIIIRQVSSAIPIPVVAPPEPVTQTETEDISEISPQDMGFSTDKIIDTPEIDDPPPPPLVIQKPIPLPKIPKISIRLPKKLLPYYLTFVAILIITIILHYFSSATIDIYLTPISITKNVDALIGPNLSASQDRLQIDSTRLTQDVTVSASTPATGKKTVGQKAQGEVMFFNKSENAIKITKGTLLTTNNLNFEVQNDVLVASSSSDLEKGIITLGQTKGQISADTIGPEYNLAKDITLQIKDNSQLIIKSAGALAGGSRQEISAVSQVDKTTIEDELDTKISQSIDQKIASSLNNDDSILKDTAIIKKSKIELNREVGEETDMVEGTVSATISYFSITPQVKDSIVRQVISSDQLYDQIDDQNITYQFDFTPKTVTENQAIGTLTISASAPPKFDQQNIKNKIKLTTSSVAGKLIRQLLPRTYKYNISLSGPSPYRLIDLLPLNPQNIKIIVHPSQL